MNFEKWVKDYIVIPDHPPRVLLELDRLRIEFIRLEDDQYIALVDGTKRQIQTVQKRGWNSSPDEPELSIKYSTNINTLLRCLELGITPATGADRVEFSANEQWGHYRQNTYWRVSIAVGESGVVEIKESIEIEDGSYY